MSSGTPKASRKVRSFALSVLPGEGETFGLELEELAGEERAPSGLKLNLNPARTRRVMESVLAAAKASGHAKSAVGISRRRPLGDSRYRCRSFSASSICAKPVSRWRKKAAPASVGTTARLVRLSRRTPRASSCRACRYSATQQDCCHSRAAFLMDWKCATPPVAPRSCCDWHSAWTATPSSISTS